MQDAFMVISDRREIWIKIKNPRAPAATRAY
jgi:hypothetical protein